jgi:hypothetical protein
METAPTILPAYLRTIHPLGARNPGFAEMRVWPLLLTSEDADLIIHYLKNFAPTVY